VAERVPMKSAPSLFSEICTGVQYSSLESSSNPTFICSTGAAAGVLFVCADATAGRREKASMSAIHRLERRTMRGILRGKYIIKLLYDFIKIPLFTYYSARGIASSGTFKEMAINRFLIILYLTVRSYACDIHRWTCGGTLGTLETWLIFDLAACAL
jgi:hypothetical protein